MNAKAYRKPARANPRYSERNLLIRTIHAAARQRGLDDDTRKAIQFDLVGKHSCKDMTITQLHKVARSLKDQHRSAQRPPIKQNSSDPASLGEAAFSNIIAMGGQASDSQAQYQPAARGPGQRLIYRLFWLLCDHGLFDKPHTNAQRKAALRAFVKRQTGLAAVEFIPPHQQRSVVEALKAIAKRNRLLLPSGFIKEVK